MTRWVNYFKYLATYNYENLPNSITFLPKILLNTKLTLINLPKTWNILPKWQNFSESGHTASFLLQFCFQKRNDVVVVVKRQNVSFEKIVKFKRPLLRNKKASFLGCRYSSVDLSAPFILLPRVWAPSTPSMLLSIKVKFVLHLSLHHCEKNKHKQKEAGFAHFLKRQVWALAASLFKTIPSRKIKSYK